MFFGFLIAYLLKCITKGIIHLFIHCTKVEKKQTKLSLYAKKAAVVQTSLKIDPNNRFGTFTYACEFICIQTFKYSYLIYA